MSKKGGYYCAFKNCRGLSRRDKRSFFRFPKDPQRSKQWVEACNRNDLLEKTPIELFNSYRVCAKHFTDSMFLNDLRNRLQPNSVPMQLEPSEEPDDLFEIHRKEDELPLCPDPVAKLLTNCTLEKISADEFFKATGIRINEPVSAIKATEDYSQNSNLIDHIYSNSKSTIHQSNKKNIVSVNIDDETSNNSFPDESLSYQDLINSLPISLISDPSTGSSSMETDELSFIIPEKTVEVEKVPEAILKEQDGMLALSTMSNTFEPLEIMKHTDFDGCLFKGKDEQTTQTENLFLENNLEETSQTAFIHLDNKIGESFQTKYKCTINTTEKFSQTTSNLLKYKLHEKKLKKMLLNKKNEIRALKSEIHHKTFNVNDITLEQFELLTEKFFPKETSDFIKMQAQLFNNNKNKQKYTLDFKKQCLSLLLAGPKTYKNLQKIFCLPGVHDLESIKF